MRLAYIILLILVFGCSSSNPTEIFISIPKSSIPQGIVIDPLTKNIFISSLHLDQLTQVNQEGQFIKTIFDRERNGYSKGAGMDIYKDKLYALATYDRDSFSMLYIKNKNTERTLSYDVKNETAYFNDLAIDNKGHCYITDTEHHLIYYFDAQKKTITEFLSDEQIRYPNGIAISDDQSKLFIDSYTHGIRIVDIKTEEILNTLHSPTAEWGVDGIKYYRGKLYFIVNGIKDKSQHGLYSLDLIDDETEIGNLDPVMVFHKKMQIPTTFSISDNYAYVIANSQMDLMDQKNNIIIDTTKLNKTCVLKKQLSQL